MIRIPEMTENGRTARQQELLDQVKLILEQLTCFRAPSCVIHIDERDGTLVLSGHLPSFYLKQLLQTTIRGIDGVKEIDNQVSVTWPADRTRSGTTSS